MQEKDGGWLPLKFGIVFFTGLASATFFPRVNKRQMEAKKTAMLERAVLFNNAPCGYHSVDEDGYIINVNDTLLKWLGYERHEVIGKLRFSDIVDDDAHRVSEKVTALELSPDRSVDINLIRKNGSTFPAMLGIVNTEGLTDDTSRRLFSTIDNTRCHEALERIKNLDQELEAFSYSISHDLRAPLRSIDGYSKILQEDYGKQLDEDGRRVLNVVMNNARRMSKLIDDLLSLGRLGRKDIQRTQVNMDLIVRNILQELQARQPERKTEVKIGNLLSARADADMMRLLWFNLLENAFKFTSKKDRAHIEIRSYEIGGREICYEVKDDGVGFDMQYVDKLFGTFQRLHKVQDFSGTGMGLAIVKRITSRHGGRVWAEASVDQGATFYFTLPIDYENT